MQVVGVRFMGVDLEMVVRKEVGCYQKNGNCFKLSSCTGRLGLNVLLNGNGLLQYIWRGTDTSVKSHAFLLERSFRTLLNC